ncbi:MAG: MFS transporter [Comamonadaceae bacterium]|nr:MFS transporter [Comamonadaceae bacterium]
MNEDDALKEKKVLGLSRNVTVAGLVSFFMDFSSEMIYPLVPLFLSNVLGVNKSLIGLIEGIAESTASLLKVFSGWASDRMGTRKWVMAAGYGISALGRPIVALASLWQHVLAFRFVDRLGKGVRTAPRDAIIAESSSTASLGKAFGFHRSMDTLGAVVGPATAFFFLSVFSNDFRLVFWLSMIPAAVAVLLIVLFITDTGKGSSAESSRPKFSVGDLNWRFTFFTGIATLFALGNSSDVFLILRAQHVGVPVSLIPVVYLVFNVIYSLSAVPAGVAADRFGRKRVILLGFLLFSAVYCGFAVVTDATLVWLLFGMYGLFMGLTEGVQKAFLSTIIPAEFKATAFGVYNSAVGIAVLPASIIGGWLWDHYSPAATFLFGSITAALSAMLFLIFMVAVRRSDAANSK